MTTTGTPRRPAQPGIATRRIRRFRDGRWVEADDVVAVEEPLEIRVVEEGPGGLERRSIAVTMRTPGHDFELVAGFLAGESIIARREDVLDISYCTDETEPQRRNIVNVTLRPGLRFDASRLERNFYTTSSCGICGKAALEALEVTGCMPLSSDFTVPASLLGSLPDRLRAEQEVFEQTGGLHASALFDGVGRLLSVREDVGRHNALDKVIGRQLLDGRLPLERTVLMLSGRASFELLQKALVARIPIVAAVGAPSSLAVELAEAFSVTLAGFVRVGGFNVYSSPERLIAAGA